MAGPRRLRGLLALCVLVLLCGPAYGQESRRRYRPRYRVPNYRVPNTILRGRDRSTYYPHGNTGYGQGYWEQTETREHRRRLLH